MLNHGFRYISEAAPGQVIFLSHNEEIYGQYAKALSPKIRKQFLVTFDSVQDGAGVSTVRDDKYF
jgi:DNA sulfur modification protein DndD